jgi:ethanolamine utilization microcompartment shell protein EutS
MTAAEPVLRVTPMMIVEDIAPVVARYSALGFERIESGSAGCVGMQSGASALIVASVAFMNGDFDPGYTERLKGKTLPYVHVTSVDQAKLRLSTGARVMQDSLTRGGTRELLVEDADDMFILAERLT